MPGYDRFQKLSKEIPDAVKLGSVSVTWIDGGKALEYQKGGRRYHFDLTARTLTDLGPPSKAASPAPERRRDRPARPEHPERGRQFTTAQSPDGKWKAFYRDRNLWLSATNSTNVLAITTDGSDKSRVKYATANWVYGEELFQTTAMWWSTNSQKIAFYRFDESQVRDYYQTARRDQIPEPVGRGAVHEGRGHESHRGPPHL